jgi:AcrR family transcriptional regulator
MSGASQPSAADGRAAADERILEAALGLIAEEGFAAVTMSRIAQIAGVSRQTLYNHYSDIDGIVAEAINRHNRESIQLLDAALRVVDQPADQLEQLVRHTVAMGAHTHHAPGIQQGLSADMRAMLGTYDEHIEGRIREMLEAGQRAGVFRKDLDPEIDAGLIRHMLNGLAEQAAYSPDTAAQLATAGTRTVRAAVART